MISYILDCVVDYYIKICVTKHISIEEKYNSKNANSSNTKLVEFSFYLMNMCVIAVKLI